MTTEAGTDLDAVHSCDTILEQLGYLRRHLGLIVETCRATGLRLRVENGVHLYESTLEGLIEVGGFSYVNPRCELNDVRIGRYCSIASGVIIGPHGHPTDWLSTHPYV